MNYVITCLLAFSATGVLLAEFYTGAVVTGLGPNDVVKHAASPDQYWFWMGLHLASFAAFLALAI